MLNFDILPELELMHEYWIQRLLNQNHSSPLCKQCVGFRIQS